MAEADVHSSFDAQGAMQLIGAKIVSVEPGRVEVEVPWRQDLTQQDGFFHAGIITTAVDSAGGYAAFTMMPEGKRVLATEFKMNFLRPAVGDKAIAIGTVVKPGKTLTVCELEVYVEKDGERKLCAKGLQTSMAVEG